MAWRAKNRGGRNTAISELKLFGKVMDEAQRRGYCDNNPARKLGLKRAEREEHRVWTDEELAKADAWLAENDPHGWRRVAFLLGRYQACRLRQSQVPLSCIDLERNVITYPAEIVKGGKGYTQPLDGRLLPALREIAEHRRSISAATLCDLPVMASLELRRWLDSIGITGVSQHDLRRTWVTKAAMSGIPEAIAQKFSNHSATEIHRVYMRFSVADVASMLDRLA